MLVNKLSVKVYLNADVSTKNCYFVVRLQEEEIIEGS